MSDSIDPLVVPRPPWPTRALSGVLGGLMRLGLGRRWFEPEVVIAAARRKTGLHPLGSEGYEDRLARFIDSIERQAGLSALGRAMVYGFMVDATSNRLRLTELVRRHPEIADIPVEEPVFIAGWPRTGTTALHDMMSLDPGLHAPPLWALMSPVPVDMRPEGDQSARRVPAERAAAFARRAAPEMMAAHPLHAQLPDECQFLFDNEMFTATFIAYAAHDYGHWMLGADATEFYRRYRTQLQVLQWALPESERGRLVLKWPFHLWHLDALLAVFPDARVVQTHRAIDRALPSLCNLTMIVQSMFCARVDPRRLGTFWLEEAVQGIERGLAARERLPDTARIYDLSHARLVKGHVEEISRLYEGLGLPWPAELGSSIRTYLDDNPRGHRGRHRYRMEWFGLDPAQLADRFAAYHERFGDRLSDPGREPDLP